MRKKILVTMLFILLFLPVLATATDENGDAMTAEEFLAALEMKTGEIVLPGGIATLSMPDEFRYLSPDDTERVLVDAWGNPPGASTRGMIVPADTSVLDDGSWAVIISYEEDGYVSDKEADSINYAELLSDMQESTVSQNKARLELGYETVDLVGWASEPYYDKDSHKLHWAKELKFGEDEINTLNYNVRILGRKGVLVLNVVSGMPQLTRIQKAVPAILAMTEFNKGYRYSDFDPGTDKVAAYGIAALIGGKMAAKAGLFAKLGALLVAFKKGIIVAVVAVGGLLAKLLGRKKVATSE